jgi:hypothetical protein
VARRRKKCKCGKKATHHFHPISGKRVNNPWCRECSERIVRDEAWRSQEGSNIVTGGRRRRGEASASRFGFVSWLMIEDDKKNF